MPIAAVDLGAALPVLHPHPVELRPICSLGLAHCVLLSRDQLTNLGQFGALLLGRGDLIAQRRDGDLPGEAFRESRSRREIDSHRCL